MAKWEEEDRRTIALRGDVIAIAHPLRFLLVPRATWKSYWVLLIIQSKPTRRGDMAGVAFSGGKKKKGGKKKIKAGSHARMEYETIRKTEASGGEGLIIVPLDK